MLHDLNPEIMVAKGLNLNPEIMVTKGLSLLHDRLQFSV